MAHALSIPTAADMAAFFQADILDTDFDDTDMDMLDLSMHMPVIEHSEAA